MIRAKSNVEVFALARKEVQTYALSIGGGFVGVGASVSVWTIGTQAVASYNTAEGGPDRGVFSASTATSSTAYYRKGDVVTVGTKRYAAKVDHASDGGVTGHSAAPNLNPYDWQGESGALNGPDRGAWSGSTDYFIGDEVTFGGQRYAAKVDLPSGDPTDGNPDPDVYDNSEWQPANQSVSGADGVASGDGSNGYKSVLGGTTSSAPSSTPWVSGTTYNQGDVVSFGGKNYRARRDTVDTATAPNANFADWWLLSGGETATNSRISSGLTAPNSTLAGSGPGRPW